MNLRQMEVFHAIMEAGSVSGAARLLRLSQPAVTNLLRYTEDQLKFPLFARIKGRLQPTQEAHALFGHVQLVFEHVRTVHQMVEDLRETRSGFLNIATIPSLGMVAVPRAVTQFLGERPQVRIRLQVRPQRQVLELIASQAIDVGFAFLTPQHGNVSMQELWRGRLECIMPAGHALADAPQVTPRELARWPVIGYARSQGLLPLIQAAFTRARVRLDPVIEVGLISTAWSLVQGGAGVALVDNVSRLHEAFPGVVARPFVPETELAIELLHPTGRPPSLLARAFARHMRSIVAREASPGQPAPRGRRKSG